MASSRINFTFTFSPSNVTAPDNLNFISCSFLTPASSGDYFIITINTVNHCHNKFKSTRFLITYSDEHFKFFACKIVKFADVNFLIRKL